uniref:E3 ubiquitin-protein ligase n=1 Tax=Clastoptera arizonana TaxID=38151 RepID=A0A1B6BZK9_9HEMI
MKRQYYPRSRSKPRNEITKSFPQSRRASLASDNLMPSSINLETLNDGLMALLECPVCFETMLPPIFQCKEGHNVCHLCKEKLKNCPTCRQMFVGRNIAVEHMSNKLLHHCVNQDVGCKELLTLEAKPNHEQICCFRKYDCLSGEGLRILTNVHKEVGRIKQNYCNESVSGLFVFLSSKLPPLNKSTVDDGWNLPVCFPYPIQTGDYCSVICRLNPNESTVFEIKKSNNSLKKNLKPTSWVSILKRKAFGCVWSGTRFDILQHMKSAHPDMANIGRDVFDFNKSQHEISLVSAFDEVFWLHIKRDPRKKLVFVLVSYIGPITNASNYLYNFKVYSRKSGNKVSYTMSTPSDTISSDELFKNGGTIAMNYKTVKPFIDEHNKLPWKLKIKVAQNKS